MMDKAGAGVKKVPALNEEGLPEWIKLIREYTRLKKKEEDMEENNSHKHLAFTTGLYALVFRRIKELEKHSNFKSRIIRFPVVFKKLCASLQITKEQAWELLFLFKDLGFLEIVPYQGIRIRNNRSAAKALLRL